jgi:transposase
MSKRKQNKPDFKSWVATEALKGEQTVTELASRFGVHPKMIRSTSGSAPCWTGPRIYSSVAAERRRRRSLRKRSRSFTRRSVSWLSPMIFCRESSSPGPGSEETDGGSIPSAAQRGRAVQPAVDPALDLPLQTSGRDAAEPDALDDEERQLGIRCVGAAIRNRRAVVGAVSVTSPKHRFLDSRLPILADLVTATAAQISLSIERG